MTIAFVLLDGTEEKEILTLGEAVTFPYHIGDEIELSVNVKDSDKWDVDDLSVSVYTVKKIKHYARKDYVHRVFEYQDATVYLVAK